MSLMDEKKDINRIFIEKITQHLYRYYWQELGLRDWESRVQNRINEVPRDEQILKTIASFTGSLRVKKVLVVGSGWGGACVAARNLGAGEVIGLDTDDEANEIANLRMRLAGYGECCRQGSAENMPFRDNYFDYVHCFTVLEHVSDVPKALSEMIRVTKKGGFVFIQGPSYLRPVERHYKIPYMPLMPRAMARIYLRLLKRPPSFIDTINYIWPAKVKRLLSNMGNIEVEQIADEYRVKFAQLGSSRDDDYALPMASVSDKANAARRFGGKVINKLLAIFYKAWDLLFGTKEIYFLIRKRRDEEKA